MNRLPPRQRPYLWIAGLLLAVESAIWAAGLAAGDTARLRIAVVYLTGFWPGLLGDWQSNFPLQPATMFATYWLVHAGPVHLFGNLAVTAWFAQRIGPALHPAETWEIWGASILGGAIAFGLLSQSYSPMIGASGGVFGLLGAFVVIDHATTRADHGLTRSVLQTLAVCALIAALSVVDFILRNGILAWQAHLGGFVTGAILTAAIAPKGHR